MYCIGIDIGTGSTKAVAVDNNGNVLITSNVPYPTLGPQPGSSEQDPEIIWEACVKCVQRITASLKFTPQAICFSSAMHSLIPVDKDCNPLTNMITWADNRSADIATSIKNSSAGINIYKQTGTPIHAMSPLCKIIWLRENSNDIFNRTYKFISIKEYIWYKVHKVYQVDHSIASATGLFNIDTRQWHLDSLLLCEIDENRLSELVDTSYHRDLTDQALAEHLNVPSGTPFFIGASDGCLANLGSFAIEPGVAALTIGTSGAIRVASSTPVRNFESMTFNYILDEKTYICGGPINNGGVALKWYAENLLGKTLTSQADYKILLQNLTDIDAGSNGLIFLPYILGERAPIWNSESCGVFFGITSQHKQVHFTRAVLEGICFALYQISKSIEDSGVTIHHINASGGFIKSDIWVQILADIFGKEIKISNNADASAIGAVLIGMKALGFIERYDAWQGDEVTSFLPNLSNYKIYNDVIFRQFEQLYKVLMLDMGIQHERKKTELTYAK